jgi:hypothetical protein
MAEAKKNVGRKPTIKKEEVKGNIVKFLIDVKQKVEGGLWLKGEEYKIADNKRVEFIIKNGWGILVNKTEEPVKEPENSEETEVKE